MRPEQPRGDGNEQPRRPCGHRAHRALNRLIFGELRVDHAKRQNQRDRQQQQAGHGHHRPGKARDPRAEQDGDVDDVRPRQHLAHRKDLGEFADVQPAALAHQFVYDDRKNAAEPGYADHQETAEQPAKRDPAFIHRAAGQRL